MNIYYCEEYVVLVIMKSYRYLYLYIYIYYCYEYVVLGFRNFVFCSNVIICEICL